MKTRISLLIVVVLVAVAGKVMAQDLVPKGKLVYVEYTDTFRSGAFSESYKARQLAGGKVEVSVYDYYQDFDSLTVYGDRQPLDSIQRVITRWIQWFNPKGKRANDSGGKGRFMAVYDSGDTLLVKRFVWCYGMKDIHDYMRDYSTYQKTQMPFEEIRGAIPRDMRWHDGERLLAYVPKKGITARRYMAAGKEILVFRNAAKEVTDIWVKADKKDWTKSVRDARMAMLSGVYENNTGISVFGRVNAAEKRYEGAPGGNIEFQCIYFYDKVVFTDTIYWGHNRVQEVNPPPGAPPGWNGAGALTGPTTWVVKFTRDGLHVKEVETGRNAPTHPSFGEEFTLKKIRGPYRYCDTPWSITTEQPLTNGQLSMLTSTQIREMLAEIGRRHADGSRLTEMERLNQSFLKYKVKRK